MHFAEVWGAHEWTNRCGGEMWGLAAANAYATALCFFPVQYGDLTPQQFKGGLAYQLMHNPFRQQVMIERLRSPTAAAGTDACACKLPKLPANEQGKYGQTKCRYCKGTTIWHCQKCSFNGNWFDVCRVGTKPCITLHRSGIKPEKSARESKKRPLGECVNQE